MKKWIIVGIILLLSITNINADVTYVNGTGVPPFGCGYNNRFVKIGLDLEYSTDYVVYYSGRYEETVTCPNYIKSWRCPKDCSGCTSCNPTDDDATLLQRVTSGTSTDEPCYCELSGSDSGYASQVCYILQYQKSGGDWSPDLTSEWNMTLYYNIVKYTISGNINCVSNIKLYKDNVLVIDDSNLSSSYSYDIINGSTYKIVFNNNYEYEFICTGDINYDYDGCAYCTINIQDECANLLNGIYTVIYDIDKNMDVVYSGYNNPITIPSSQVDENDELRVIWSTWMGGVQKTCYAQFDHDINLYDPMVYWIMDVYVYDNESNPIEDVNVDFNQDCVINGYPARNKYTDYDGLAEFTQCENKNANLVVSKDGYQTLSTGVSGGWYDAYTNTYEISVVLQASDSGNNSVWDLINNSINDTNATEEPQDVPDANGTPINVNLYFKDCNGQYTTQINDSDPYVRCYYDVIAMKPVSMTLSFQSSLSGYWFTDIYTYPYTIDNNSYGYMNLSNDNFSDSDYIYRAYIHDASYPEYDRYVYLSVVNQTSEQETHYENLSGYCMFMNTNDNGSIDYRENIVCYALVMSDNASLRTVSLELYDNSTLIDYINLTNSSFDDDLYEWELEYTYSLSHNYSLVLKGYDGSILDCDNVIAYNLVGNKLTIKVTDAFNHNLNHVYVYVEHYGSINTGWLNYGTFEGLPNGESRYKATKSGYRSGVWKSVNLTDENEIVTYQLIEDAPEGSVASVRLSDSDVKDIYYPFMYFLLIIILIGALMNVIN